MTFEAAWPSGLGPELNLHSLAVDLQLLHALSVVANWSASCQLGFLASFSFIYSIVSLFQCPQLVQHFDT